MINKAAQAFRSLVYDENKHSYLLSRISESSQACDLSVPCNCDGYGRIHHFRRIIDSKWVEDPLPMDPACHALGIPAVDIIETQVFQLAACNVNCWYCFVPNALKCADSKMSRWFTAEEMVKSYRDCTRNIRVLDLSGGNPELCPEWILDSMRALEKMNLSEDVYLWSDDTLTTDFLFDMDRRDIAYMSSYPMYGKVCCFKGFDEESFSFNSGLEPKSYEGQFQRFERYLDLGFDLYGYVTLTCGDTVNIEEKINTFLDRLQKIHPLLPLRTIPLKILVFTPTQKRMNAVYTDALNNQFIAIDAWKKSLKKRFSDLLLCKKVYENKLE